MIDGEVYPGSPLVSVAFELRHPPTEPLLGSQRSELQRKLAARFPLMRSHRSVMQEVELGPGGPITHATSEEFPRFVNRARTMAISVLQTSLLIETTDYPGWIKFRPDIEFACQIRNSVSPIYGLERIGLRYVDEVRNPDGDSAWGNWIVESLLGGDMSSNVQLPLRTWQGALIYGTEPGHGMVLRYGPGDGFATDPNAELRRIAPPAPGPFFLLDIDSFWQPENDVPEYAVDSILTLADQLHTPVRTLFESTITDRYRDEVLRK